MQNLFTYGSLRCEDIMFAVVGQVLRHHPASLADYRCYTVKNEQYPGVVSETGGSVEGVVYYDIEPEGWLRLDRFEGEPYPKERADLHSTILAVPRFTPSGKVILCV